METQEFFKYFKRARPKLTKQQWKTIRGQALSGDINGAVKGLIKILKRRGVSWVGLQQI